MRPGVNEEAATPRLGFGVDYKYRDRYPGGLPGVVDCYRARLSHLSVVALADVEEARAFCSIADGLPTVHHLSEVAPADPDGADLTRLRRQDALSREIDASWCGEDIGIWSLGPYSIPYFAPPLFDADVADAIATQIDAMKVWLSCPFHAEVPSCTFVAGELDLGTFFHRIVDATGCGVVLDLSHVWSYSLTVGRDVHRVLSSLPLDAVVEVHVAGGRTDRQYPFRYIDSHSDAIVPVVFDLLRAAVASCPGLRAVTYELGNRLPADVLAEDFGRLEHLLEEEGFVPRAREAGDGA